MYVATPRMAQDKLHETCICDRACENRPSERKLKFSVEEKLIFTRFKFYMLDGRCMLWAHAWRFITFCNEAWLSYGGKYKGM